MRIKPITPNEIVEKKQEIIPERVIECWNELIANDWDGLRSEVLLSDARQKLSHAMACPPEAVKKPGWILSQFT